MDEENISGKASANQKIRLSTILRRSDGLFAILSKRRYAFEPPMPLKEVEKGEGFDRTLGEACL
jgi:hypothetical protein